MADLWDVLQQLDLWGLQAQLNQANRSQLRRGHTQDQKILALEEENEEMRLQMTVLLNLLVAKKVLTAEEITAVFTALEAERKSQRCPQCGFTYKWDGRRCGHCNFQAETAATS